MQCSCQGMGVVKRHVPEASRAENLQIFRSKEAMEPISVRATLSGPLERSPRVAPCVRCGHRRPQRNPAAQQVLPLSQFPSNASGQLGSGKLAPVLGACMGAGLAVARKVRRRATDVERPLESLVEAGRVQRVIREIM